MKKIILILMTVLPTFVWAEDYIITDVCGATFGDSYENVKTVVTKVVGKKPSFDWHQNCLIFKDVNIEYMGLKFSAFYLGFTEKKAENTVSLPSKEIKYTIMGNDTIARDTINSAIELTLPSYEHLLNSAKLIFLCKTETEASLRKSQIEAAMKKKYQLTERKGKLYGGLSPQNHDYFGFCIEVAKSAKIFGDSYPYSAILVFGPYDYNE